MSQETIHGFSKQLIIAIENANTGACLQSDRLSKPLFSPPTLIGSLSSSNSKPSKQERWPRAAVLLFSLTLLTCKAASAQSFQFLPEIDAYIKIQPDVRFNFQAKETREAGAPTQAEVGPGFDFFLKPLVRLKRITAFDLDEAKSRPLQLSVGF